MYGFGYRLKPQVTIDDLMHRLHITLKHEIEIMQDQLSRNGVKVIQGVASFTGEHRLQIKSVDDEILEVEADKILLRPRWNRAGLQPVTPAVN